MSASWITRKARPAHYRPFLASYHLEQFTGSVVSRADASRRHVDLSGIHLGVGDELGNRLDRHRGIHLHGKGLAMNARDRRDVADQIEIEPLIERGVDRVHRSDHQERISVQGRVHDHLSAHIAGSSWSVLDDELLPEPLRQPLSYQAGPDVGGPTRV